MIDKIERYVKRNKSLVYIADKLGLDVAELVSEIAASEINLNSFTSEIEDEDVIIEAREAFLTVLLQNN